MNNHQMEQGKIYLSGWLVENEMLKKSPAKIECAFEFDAFNVHYYVYKFKKSALGKWFVGVCGFNGDSME